MKQIRAITDEEVGFELKIGDRIIPIVATDVLIYWDEARNNNPDIDLETRYDNFRMVLSERWGVDINKPTAFQVLETGLQLVASLKKTLLLEANSKSLESTPKENQPAS